MSLILLGILNSQAAGAGGAGAYDLLETIEPSGVNSVSFTGLNTYTDYKHLQLRMSLRWTINSDILDTLYMRVNNSGANYYTARLTGSGFNVSSSQTGSSGQGEFYQSIVGDTAPANEFAPLVLDVLDFHSANKFHTMRATHGYLNSTRYNMTITNMWWRDQTAISSLQFFTAQSGYNFASGTRMSLYGVK